jgi:hypothetical protein
MNFLNTELKVDEDVVKCKENKLVQSSPPKIVASRWVKWNTVTECKMSVNHEAGAKNSGLGGLKRHLANNCMRAC